MSWDPSYLLNFFSSQLLISLTSQLRIFIIFCHCFWNLTLSTYQPITIPRICFDFFPTSQLRIFITSHFLYFPAWNVLTLSTHQPIARLLISRGLSQLLTFSTSALHPFSSHGRTKKISPTKQKRIRPQNDPEISPLNEMSHGLEWKQFVVDKLWVDKGRWRASSATDTYRQKRDWICGANLSFTCKSYLTEVLLCIIIHIIIQQRTRHGSS